MVLDKGTDIRTKAIVLIQEAAKNLIAAQTLLQTANPMAADVPVVKELGVTAKGLSESMLAVSKLRGL
jgi:hypothetical protein